MNMKNSIFSALRTLCALCLCGSVLYGCGYHLRGFGDALPEDLHTITIAPFGNRTYETNLATLIEGSLAEEFSKTRRLKVVSEGGDLLLEGEVLSYSNSPKSFSSSDLARDYRVEVVVDVVLKRVDADEVIWKGKGLKEVEDYSVDPGNINEAEISREAAKEEIADELAELIYDRVFEGF